MKKIILLATAILLTVLIAVGGTIAYFQDEDSDVNVITMGNVYIKQIEQERNANGELVDFTQAKPAYPVVGQIAWDNNGLNINGTEYKVFSSDLKNVIDKIVTVKNTGKGDAYVRTVIAIEAPEGDPNDLIHVNVNSDGLTKTPWAPATIDGVDYVISTFTYNEALKPGKTTPPSLLQVFLDSKATNEDCEPYGDTWEILVVSQAVQTEGFDDPMTALNTAFGEITATDNPWTADPAAGKLVTVSNSDEAKEAIAKANDNDVIYLKEGTYSGLAFTNPANYTAKDLTILGADGAIVEGINLNNWAPVENSFVVDGLKLINLTFTKSLLLSTRSMANVTIMNCDFINDAAIHQNDNTEKLTNLVVKDCTFTGNNIPVDANDKNNATAIMLENTENATITGCTFTNIDFNVVQCGTISGDLLFDGNTVNGTGDRVFRFVNVNADVTISNNTITSNGDADGELAKSSSACVINFSNNTWNGLADVEVFDKFININKYTASSEDQFAEAIQNNGTVTLNENVSYTDNIEISSDATVAVELGDMADR